MFAGFVGVKVVNLLNAEQIVYVFEIVGYERGEALLFENFEELENGG